MDADVEVFGFIDAEITRMHEEAAEAEEMFQARVRGGSASPAVLRALSAYAQALARNATAATQAFQLIVAPDAADLPKSTVSHDARGIILRLAAAPGGVKNKTVAGALGVERTTAFRYLSALKNEGVIVMRGQSRAAAWHLVSDDAR
jgi:predicted HTH transcriptional regulator